MRPFQSYLPGACHMHALFSVGRRIQNLERSSIIYNVLLYCDVMMPERTCMCHLGTGAAILSLRTHNTAGTSISSRTSPFCRRGRPPNPHRRMAGESEWYGVSQGSRRRCMFRTSDGLDHCRLHGSPSRVCIIDTNFAST